MEKLSYKNIEYVKRLPENFVPTEKYPLVIYIHGAGGRGRNIDKIYTHPFFVETEKYLSGAVSVAPQCYADTWFDIFEQLQEYIEAMVSLEYVDKSCVYLLGASMGGYTTWQLAMSHPELFAAIVPICGGGMYWNAGRLKSTAVWAFHGEADPTVLCEESKKMVEKINKAGGNARLTVYEGIGHNAWTPTFRDAEVWRWVFEQRNAYVSDTKNEYDNVKDFG
ncbi:MAG: prolyl oligopeptidase family serine peptidase [Clostridia bacterium]|nr:prolyl oligopeptidase family serine peptidase [Clostridia bacterium]